MFSIEEIFYSNNVKSSLLLGHARGVAIAAAATNGRIKITNIDPKIISTEIALLSKMNVNIFKKNLKKLSFFYSKRAETASKPEV